MLAGLSIAGALASSVLMAVAIYRRDRRRGPALARLIGVAVGILLYVYATAQDHVSCDGFNDSIIVNVLAGAAAAALSVILAAYVARSPSRRR